MKASFGIGTNPLDADSNNDAFTDGMEIGTGNDPPLGGDGPVWDDTGGNGAVNVIDVLPLTRVAPSRTTRPGDQRARDDIAQVIAGIPMPDNVVSLGDLLVIKQILPGLASYP